MESHHLPVFTGATTGNIIALHSCCSLFIRKTRRTFQRQKTGQAVSVAMSFNPRQWNRRATCHRTQFPSSSTVAGMPFPVSWPWPPRKALRGTWAAPPARRTPAGLRLRRTGRQSSCPWPCTTASSDSSPPPFGRTSLSACDAASGEPARTESPGRRPVADEVLAGSHDSLPMLQSLLSQPR